MLTNVLKENWLAAQNVFFEQKKNQFQINLYSDTNLIILTEFWQVAIIVYVW